MLKCHVVQVSPVWCMCHSKITLQPIKRAGSYMTSSFRTTFTWERLRTNPDDCYNLTFRCLIQIAWSHHSFFNLASWVLMSRSWLCILIPSFFCVFFYRSSSAFTSPVFHLDPARLLGHLLCRGLPKVCIFVSGSSRIQTHVLIITKRTP